MSSNLDHHPDGERIVRAEFKRIAGELTERVYLGNLMAVAMVFVDKDGDLSTRIAFQVGAKLPLLAGTTMLQHGMIDEIKIVPPKPIDPEETQ